MIRRQPKQRGVPKHKTEEERQRLREGRYKYLYGDNWKEVLDVREKARQDAITLQERQRQDRTALTPRLYGDSFLGKTEFCRLLILRLRDPKLGDGYFVTLANLFAAIKQWLPNKQESIRKVFPIQPRAQKVVDTELARQQQDESEAESTEALNELVLKLEEQQKKEQQNDGQLDPERDSNT